MKKGRRRLNEFRTGFTLIELLVSSVLCLVLMVLISRVMASAARETRQVADNCATRQTTHLLEEQLRRDIQNARGLLIEPQRVRLYGFVSRDPKSHLPTFQPASVTYQVVPLGTTAALVRAEQVVGSPGTGGVSQTDVLWQGVGSLRITAGLVSEADALLEVASPMSTGGLAPVPPSVHVILLDASGRSLLATTIYHHWEG